MIGAIIGDIVGSRHEFNNYKAKDFKLLTPKCYFTDDTVMTIAVATAIRIADGKLENLTSELICDTLQFIGRHYPNCGYGAKFIHWMFSEDPQPYNSFGNGSAMRVSSVAWAANSLEECLEMARRVTVVSHDHPEGIKGAEATAAAIYLARFEKDKQRIKQYIEDHYYKLDFTIDGIRDTYIHNETCQDSVPQALEAFLESESYEDCLRIAVSLGGDSDTIAAIAGSVAEAYYGIP